MKQTPVIVQVHVPSCPKCGGTAFKRGGTSREMESTGQILRYRKCATCGKTLYFAYPAPPILPVEQKRPAPIDR